MPASTSTVAVNHDSPLSGFVTRSGDTNTTLPASSGVVRASKAVTRTSAGGFRFESGQLRSNRSLPRVAIRVSPIKGRENACELAIRQIPFKIQTFEELRLPPVVQKLAERPRGLVLVTGPTGSGKSTTLAAMLDKVNKERRGHILTIEDPIEFIHRPQG